MQIGLTAFMASLKAIKMWRHAITVVTELSTPVMIP